MRIARDVLERFTALPTNNRELRLLMDDVGLEVKRIDDSSGPVIFTLELLANRGDHHCYRGVAREITGRTGLPLLDHSTATLDLDGSGWPVDVRSDKLLRYTTTTLVRTGSGALDDDARRVLEAGGLHSVSAPVDATNIVNLEIGQPTHVFDAAKVQGAIVVRESVSGERAWPLFTEEHIDLPAGTLVIADDVKILAIAGVIGCEDSKATIESERIILESAAFDPVSVRKASRALSIHTDSSARFERGSDPERALTGAARVVELLQRCGWSLEGGTTVVGSWVDPERSILLDTTAANGFLGTTWEPEEIADILDRYGFTSAIDDVHLQVRVPSWRLWDVAYPADLYEELAKSVGYNTVPTTLPPVGMGSVRSSKERRRARVEEVLLGAGFYECITDGFYGRAERELLGIDESHPLWEHMSTTNALDRAYGLLKNNALAQAVRAVSDNHNRRQGNLKLYEWTRTFKPNGRSASRTQSPCDETPLLWGVCVGEDNPGWAGTARPADALFLKGVIEEIGVEIGLNLSLVSPDPRHPITSLLHGGRSAAIALDGHTIGVLGEVHPGIVQRAKLKRVRPVYFELNAEALLAPGNRPPYAEPPVEQPMDRTLAFSLPMRVEAESISAWLHASGPEWLQSVEILDLYSYDDEGAPRRAVTYGLRFTAGRGADDVNDLLDQLIAAVIEQFGSAGVTQR